MSWEMLAWVAATAPLLPLVLGLYNRLTWPRPRPSDGQPRAPGAVSVLVPARNEASRILACLEGVLAQGSSVLEVIVYSDESTDETEAIVRSVAGRDPRVRLIAGGPLPRGWVGKPHACQVLAEQARGPWLVFLDADVRLQRGAVDGLLNALTRHKQETDARHLIVTALPRQQGGTWGLDLLQPLLTMTYASWLPLAWANRRTSPRLVAGCGQLLLLSRATATHLGGFHRVKDSLVDDVAYCRHARRNGVGVAFLDAHDLATCRMYSSGLALWRGFSKNVFPGLGSEMNLALALALHGGCFVLPFVLTGIWLGAAALGHRPSPDVLALALVGVLCNVLHRVVLAARHDHRALAVVLHPLAVILLMLLALDSWRRARFSRLEWAGRSYQRGLA